jgi:conjugal transfer pilus assembly protein TraV
MKTTLIPAALFLATLSGCASWFTPIGSDKFDCNRKQDANSPYCRSFKSVNAATKNDLPDSRFDKSYTVADYDKLTGIAPVDAPDSNAPSTAPQNGVAQLLPHQIQTSIQSLPIEGSPVRVGPIIQRTLIKRFVDSDDRLTENLVVYKEIRGNRWAGFDSQAKTGGFASGAYPHKGEDSSKTNPPQFNRSGNAQSDEPAVPESSNISFPQ